MTHAVAKEISTSHPHMVAALAKTSAQGPRLFPRPIGEQFVREWTEVILKDARRHGPIDGKKFSEEMKASPQIIESVIRDQVSIAKQDAFSRRHFLVMKYLGYFEGYTLRS